MGHLDTIVASAGILFLRRGAETTADELEHVLRVNVIGVHSTFRHALPAARESGRGVLLATASLASFHGSEWLGAYSASKFALLGLAQALAQEEACHGAHVCTVSPGFVQTGMMPAWLEQKSQTKQIAESDVVRAMAERISLGRIGEPEEVADVLVFLASPLARYITGANVAVDGGYRA
jgi:NAD(P)-dependent dehydrogenase (short-subunit alcohol dehydrogenase family)